MRSMIGFIFIFLQNNTYNFSYFNLTHGVEYRALVSITVTLLRLYFLPWNETLVSGESDEGY